MGFHVPLSEQAMIMLRRMTEIEQWARDGDPRAKPYLDADAVRIVDDKVEFHRDSFLNAYAEELLAKTPTPKGA
jgi:hypothetical protein